MKYLLLLFLTACGQNPQVHCYVERQCVAYCYNRCIRTVEVQVCR